MSFISDKLNFHKRNLYVCPKEENNQAKHISVAVNKWKYRLQYKRYFGGVTALSKSQVNFYGVAIDISSLYDINIWSATVSQSICMYVIYRLKE